MRTQRRPQAAPGIVSSRYWTRPTEIAPDALSRAAGDCSRLLGTVGVPLAGFSGTGAAVFGSDAIVFNGAAPASVEPFEVHRVEFDRRGRAMVRSYCKTEHAPYDLCVRLALIVLRHHLGDGLRVTSDAADESWNAARALCQTHLGYGADFRLAAE